MSSQIKHARPVPMYGAGSCHPKPLQCLASPKAFTANLAIIFFLQVCTFSYAIGIIRTLEKRFGLTSQLTGTLNSVNDIVQVIIVLLIGYFTGKAHKPRFLSVSLLVLCVGGFLYSLPYFLYGSKENIVIHSVIKTPNDTSGDRLTCKPNVGSGEDVTCSAATVQLVESNHVAFNIFVCAAILIGLGGSGLQVMGISYIDENVRNEDVALYIGVATAMFPLGPVAGFSVAALATSLPENLKHSALDSSDPAFIGAWWLGYAVFPFILAVFAIPLFFFPKHFLEYYIQKEHHVTAREANSVKEEKDGRNGKHPQTDTGGSPGSLTVIWRSLKEFPRTFMRLLSRPEFITNTFGQIFLIYMVVGIGINMTRYMEIYFLQPAFLANIMTGLSIAFAGVFGNLAGGFLMRKLRLRLQGAALMVSITTFSGIIGIAVLMLITCEQVELAGKLDDQGMLDVDLSCASNCTCVRDLYLPVCGKTPYGKKLTFLTPCHAGCQSQNGSWMYSNCSCLTTPMEMTSHGTCSPPCNAVYLYTVAAFTLFLVGSFGRVPATIVTLRVVDSDLRTFALGFQSFMVNLLSFIPGPIIYGALTDSACLVWNENCGVTGNCLFYDTDRYRLMIHGVSLVFMALGFVFVFMTWFLIRRNTAKGVYDLVDKQLSAGNMVSRTTDEHDANKVNSMKEAESTKEKEVTNSDIMTRTRF